MFLKKILPIKIQNIGKKEAISPNTNRSIHSSDQIFSPQKSQNKLFKNKKNPDQQIHCKITCNCTICQNKLNESLQ